MQKVSLWQGAVCGAGLAAFLSGCGAVRETLPARSAMEQLLISTAADRAVAQLPSEPFRGRTVFLDVTNLDCTDKAYVTQCLRTALRTNGAHLAATKDEADLTLEAASGSMSVNRREMLFGIPMIPLPLSYGGQTVKLPELPLWKTITYRGRAKLLLCLADPETGQSVTDIPLCYGSARDSYWWLFIVGPVRSTDVPQEAR